MAYTPEQCRERRARIAQQKREAGWRQRPGGISEVAMIILRRIAAGDGFPRSIAKSVKGHASGEAFDQIIERLVRDQYIRRNRGGWFVLAQKGRDQLPGALSVPMVPYRAPPAPPRRPGSDHSHIPSIAAGREHPHKHPHKHQL